jgi:catechol 2,3-dioxygenase-like lactoylglutathione lyase family enzyme
MSWMTAWPIRPNKRPERGNKFRRTRGVIPGELAGPFVSPSNPTAQITLLRADESGGVQPQMSIEVDNVDEVHARAVERGLKIVRPLADEPWGVRRFFVADPNGVVINVLSHLAR